MSKRIEKEPDGYIRDLKRKRRDPIVGAIGFNAFITSVFLILALILIIATLKPLPTKTYNNNFVLKKIDTDNHHHRYGSTTTTLFVAKSGEEFAIPTGLLDPNVLQIGKSYSITYYVGFLYQFIYTIEDNSQVLISENDQIAYRNQNISELGTSLVWFGIIWLISTILLNSLLLNWLCYKKIFEINQKIKKRRERRAKKE